MTLSRLAALQKYWADHPPLQWMVAAWLGRKPKEAPNKESDIEQLMAVFGTTK